MYTSSRSVSLRTIFKHSDIVLRQINLSENLKIRNIQVDWFGVKFGSDYKMSNKNIICKTFCVFNLTIYKKLAEHFIRKMK